MGSQELTADEARTRLIELLEAEECRITDKAERAGRQILGQWMPLPTQWAIFEFALQRLRDNFPLHAVPQGDPPGSRGVAYEMRNVDGKGLYIQTAARRRESLAHQLPLLAWIQQ